MSFRRGAGKVASMGRAPSLPALSATAPSVVERPRTGSPAPTSSSTRLARTEALLRPRTGSPAPSSASSRLAQTLPSIDRPPGLPRPQDKTTPKAAVRSNSLGSNGPLETAAREGLLLVANEIFLHLAKGGASRGYVRREDYDQVFAALRRDLPPLVAKIFHVKAFDQMDKTKRGVVSRNIFVSLVTSAGEDQSKIKSSSDLIVQLRTFADQLRAYHRTAATLDESPEALQHVKRIFQLLDEQGKKTISRREFEAFQASLHLWCDPALLEGGILGGARFDQFDKGQHGLVTREGFMNAMKDMFRHFGEDGFLNLLERQLTGWEQANKRKQQVQRGLRALETSIERLQASPPGSKTDTSLREVAEAIFVLLDQDESGSIERDEMKRLTQVVDECCEDSLWPTEFDDLDIDGDGVVSRGEMLLFFQEAFKTYGRRRLLEQLMHVAYVLKMKVERREDACQCLEEALDSEAALDEPYAQLCRLCKDITEANIGTSAEALFQRFFLVASLGNSSSFSHGSASGISVEGGLWTLSCLQPKGANGLDSLRNPLAHEFVLLPPFQGQPGSSSSSSAAALRAFRSRREWVPIDLTTETRAPVELLHPSTEVRCSLRLSRKTELVSVYLQQLRDAADSVTAPGVIAPTVLDLRHLLSEAGSRWDLRVRVRSTSIVAANLVAGDLASSNDDDEHGLDSAHEQLMRHGLTHLKVAVPDGEYRMKVAQWAAGSKAIGPNAAVQFIFEDLHRRIKMNDATDLLHRVVGNDRSELIEIDTSHPCLEPPELVAGVGAYKLSSIGGDLALALRQASMVTVAGVGNVKSSVDEGMLRVSFDDEKCECVSLLLLPGWLVHLRGLGSKAAHRHGSSTAYSPLPWAAQQFAMEYGRTLLLAEKTAKPGAVKRQEILLRQARLLAHRLLCALQQCPENGPFSLDIINTSCSDLAIRRCRDLVERLGNVGGCPSVEAFVCCFSFKRFELGFRIAQELLNSDATLAIRGGGQAAEHIMSRDPPLPAHLHQSALQLLHGANAPLSHLIIPAVQHHRPDEVVLLFEICLGERGLRIKSRGFGNEPLRKKLVRATEKGDDTEVTKLITKKKLNPNLRDRSGWTAVHHAAALGHSAVLRTLHLFKADLNMKNNDGAVPLHYATNSAAQLLREWGCSVSAVDNHGETPLMLAKKREGHYGQSYANASLDPKVQWSQIEAIVMSDRSLDHMVRDLVTLGFGGADVEIFSRSQHGKVVNPVDELQLRNQTITDGNIRGRLLCVKLLCPLLVLSGERKLCDETEPEPLPKLSFCKYLLHQKLPSFAALEVFTCAQKAAKTLEKLLVEEYMLPANLPLHSLTTAPSVLLNSGLKWVMLHQKEAHGSVPWMEEKDDVEALASLVEMELFETAEDLCDWGAGGWRRDSLYVVYLRELARRADAPFQKKLQAIVAEFPDAEYRQGPLKGEPRMLVKGREDYAPDALRCYDDAELGVGGVLDVARLSICCEDAEVLTRVVERIKESSFEKDGMEVLRQKNGFHPDAESSGGYRDFKLTILVGVPGMEDEGVRHVVECQLLLKPYLEVKKFQHVLYEVERGDCFSPHGRLGVGIFTALEADTELHGLTMLVNAVDSGFRKIYAKYKRETDAKVAEAAAAHHGAFGAGENNGGEDNIMELLELEKQREKLGPLKAERDRVLDATHVLVISCLNQSRIPAPEFDDWLCSVETEEALVEIDAVVSGRCKLWQEAPSPSEDQLLSVDSLKSSKRWHKARTSVSANNTTLNHSRKRPNTSYCIS